MFSVFILWTPVAVLIILLWILEQSVCHCPVIRAYESDDEVVDKLHAKTGILVADVFCLIVVIFIVLNAVSATLVWLADICTLSLSL